MKEEKLRFHFNILIAQRWLDLFVLVLMSCLICVLCYPLLDFSGRKLTEVMSKAHYPIGILVTWYLLTTFLWFLLIRLGGFRVQDLWSATSVRYPPTWITAFIATFFYLFFIPFVWSVPKSSDISSQMLIIILSFIPGIVTVSFLNFFFSKRENGSTIESQSPALKDTPGDIASLIQKPDSFIQWLSEEKPIHDPNDDLFESSVFARRVTRLLQQSPLKTIALVGDYGCGKSSILKITEYFIKNPEKLPPYTNDNQTGNSFDAKNIITCEVCGWGLHKGAASEHILRSAIAELSKYVDCLGLIGIPSHYCLTLSNLGSTWGKTFATLLDSSKGSLEILRQLDTVLACIRKRLIIYLEDLDRNTGDKSYWDEIVSLLDRLKDLDNISFILAINQDLKRDSGLLRISEHIEFVPVLPKIHVIECLKAFRNICLNKFPEDIDCRVKEERDKHFGLKRFTEEYAVAELLGMGVNEPIAVTANLLSNPRALKAVLRDTWRTWQTLHGELDFDDLLVARVLYTIAPEAFGFINGRLSQMRQLASNGSSDLAHKRIETIKNELNSSWQEIGVGPWDKKSVDFIIEFLFPGWIKDSFYEADVPQGLSVSKPTDYWRRLNKEEISNHEIRDQSVIHALNDWKREHSKTVHKSLNLPQALFQIDDFADKVEQFGLLLDGKEVRSLAEELFLIILRDGGRLKKEEHYSGFINLWRLSLDKPVEWHEQWVVGEIRKALPINLRFANEIYYYWRNQDRGMGSAKVQTPFVRSGFIAAGKEIFGNNSQALIKAIDPDYMYSIQHFMVHYSEPDGGGPGFKPEEWSWLTNLLIEAGEKNPQVVIPQIVTLVIEEQHRFKEKLSYILGQERLDALFMDNQRKVMQLLSKEIDTSLFDTRDKDRIQFARLEAIQWLADYHRSN